MAGPWEDYQTGDAAGPWLSYRTSGGAQAEETHTPAEPLTDEQRQALLSAWSNAMNRRAGAEAAQKSPVLGRALEFVNAAVPTAAPAIMGRMQQALYGEDPRAVREATRGAIAQYEKDHPAESYLPWAAGGITGGVTGGEILGGIPYVGAGLEAAGNLINKIPSGSTVPSRVASWMARAGLRGGAVGAPIGAATELTEEQPSWGGAAERGLSGLIAGAVIQTGLEGLGLAGQAAGRAFRGVWDRYVTPSSGGAAAGEKDVAGVLQRTGVTPQEIAQVQQDQQAAGQPVAPLLAAAREAAMRQGRPGGAHSLQEMGRAAAGVSGEAGEAARVEMGQRLLNQPAEIAKYMAKEDPQGRSFDVIRDQNEAAVTKQADKTYGEARDFMKGKAFNLAPVLDQAETKFGDILTGRTTQAAKLAEAINRFRLKPSPKDAELAQNATQQLYDLGHELAERSARGTNRGITDALGANLAADINSVASKLSAFVDPKRGSPPSAALISEISDLIPRTQNVWNDTQIKARLTSIVNDLQTARTNSLRMPATRTVDQLMAARQDIDNMISSARTAGEGPLARRLTQLRQMVNENAHNANKKLAAADEQFAGASKSEDLIEMGRDMAMRAGERQDEVLRMLPKMTPEQRELVWQGVKKHFADMATNTRRGSAGEAGSAATANQFMANNIEQVIKATAPTPARAQAMLNQFRWHAQNTATYQDVLHGSRTAPMYNQMREIMVGPQMAADALTGRGLGLAGHANELLARQFAQAKGAQIMHTLMSTDPAMAGRLDAAARRIPYHSMAPAVYITAPAVAGLEGAKR